MKSNINNAPFKSLKSNSNTEISISLDQGDQFKSYQKKINKGYGKSNVLEGFTNQNEENIIIKSNAVLDETKIDEDRVSNLKKEYNDTLTQLKSLHGEFTDRTQQYLNRVDPKKKQIFGKKYKCRWRYILCDRFRNC
jgi:hypothetical protein